MQAEPVRVYDIILDLKHKCYNSPDDIGIILYNNIDVVKRSKGCETKECCENASKARPFNSNITQYPLKNELVHLIKSVNKNYNNLKTPTDYYIHSLPISSKTTQNTFPNYIDEEGQFTMGNYFNEDLTLKRIQPYEGDILMQGRFGNSIRFGSTIDNYNTSVFNTNEWSNVGTVGDPITIITNGQPEREYSNKGFSIEDINEDKSSIWMCSNQQISNLEVASKYNESYHYNKIENQETPETPNNTMPTNVEEDVQLSTTENLNPEEVQEQESLSNIQNEDNAHYDISPTENQSISIADTFTVPEIYIIPDTTTTSYLNEDIGSGFKKIHNIYSQLAITEDINNYPGVDTTSDPTLTDEFIWDNLSKLHTKCINPLVQAFGVEDIKITSAYRSKTLNNALGGSSESLHIKGYAVDIISLTHPSSILFNWCKDNLPEWNQLIWEYPERGSFVNADFDFSWIHLSYVEGDNQKILSISSKVPSIHNAYIAEDNDETYFKNGDYTHNINEADENKI